MGSRSESPDDIPNESKPMSVNSEEMNLLVYRYLSEAGFVHSAYTFAHESLLGRSSARSAEKSIPPGALISFLQKGLQYVAIEENLQREGAEADSAKAGDERKPEKASAEASSAGEATAHPGEFTLLAPQTLQALRRENPPIQLSVPPATAAAAVKARIEAEARLNTSRRRTEETSTSSTNTQQQQQQQLAQPATAGGATVNAASTSLVGADANLVSNPIAVAAMNRLQSQPAPPDSTTSLPAATATAASTLAQLQQQRAAAEVAQIAALHQQQAQLHQKNQENDMAAALALVASGTTGNSNNTNIGHSSKSTSDGANTGTKQTSVQPGNGSTVPQETPLHVHQQQQQQPGQGSTAFSSLEEAVARLNTAKARREAQVAAKAAASQNGAVPMDIDENAGDRPQHPKPSSNEKNDQHELINGRSKNLDHVLSNGGSDSQTTKGTSNVGANGGPTQREGGNPGQNSQEDIHRRIETEDELTKALPEEVLELDKHASEVFMCAWNPVYTNLIATGSGDASARIWQMDGPTAKDGCGPVRLLPHGLNANDKKNKDVTTLEWSSDGKLLATGSYDGVARVWSRNGALVHTLSRHRGPIFSLKWNPKGNYLLSGSYDQSAIAWDVSGATGHVVQQFNFHDAPALDVDWRDDSCFASCSTDKRVLICRVGSEEPLKVYTGHRDEVNAVKWDPSGTLLASCSDDSTAKVWDATGDSTAPLYDFEDHKAEIYTVKWRPTGPGSMNPSKQKMLATASFDGSVRLWNVDDGSCIKVFSRHRDSVYSVSFSPSGEYLASGSLAGQLYIWNLKEGKQVKSYKGKGDIFEVAWDRLESRVAACFSSNVVAVIDFKAPS